MEVIIETEPRVSAADLTPVRIQGAMHLSLHRHWDWKFSEKDKCRREAHDLAARTSDLLKL